MPALSTPGTRIEIGDLVAYLDADGGFLRAIAVAGEEVLRGIGFVVRDQHWGTYALCAAPEIARGADKAVIRAAGRVTGPDGALDWSLVWTLRRDGLTAECDCTSAGGFPTNRTGFVVLHSLQAARGQAVAITHEAGQVEETVFPDLVSPHQPFMDVAAMDYATATGHRLRLRFAGEIFETEDQRNWTDASYKTYSRPLSAKPFPYRITAEMPERQQVHLDLLHIATGQPIAAAPPVVLRETVMPPLGLGVSPDTPTAGLGEAIRRLAPAFTALEIDLLRDPRLAEARLLLAAIPGALRLDIRKASPEAVLGAVQTLEPLLGGREVIGVSLWDADEALVAAARALLRGLRIGSGTGAFFTELNRGTDWPAGADYLSWTSNPTVHGSSDDTLGESVEPLDDILRTAKAKWPGRRFQLGPHTLGMRFNPNATTAEGRSRTASPDPRQGQSIAAAWMLGMFAGYADDAVETISFFEAEGPRGLVGSDGGMTAAGDLFTKLAAQRGAPVAVLTWAGQPRLRGLRVDGRAGRSYCIANLHHETTELLLPDGGHHRLGGFDTLWLGAS